jgi:CheY-like chemotaxis protein
MKIRTLLIEPDPVSVEQIRGLLAAIESGQHWGAWVRCELLSVSALVDGVDVIRTERPDLVMLRLDRYKGSASLRTLLHVEPPAPVLLLATPAEEALAARLIREGAQDFVLRGGLTPSALAHAMRNSIERDRILRAARSANLFDPVTGLPNRAGFLCIGEKLIRSAARAGSGGVVALTVKSGKRSDHLRDIPEPARIWLERADVLGRMADGRLAALRLGSEDLQRLEAFGFECREVPCGSDLASALETLEADLTPLAQPETIRRRATIAG